jgi:hypothetical protein
MDAPTTNGTGIGSNKETVGPKANDMGRIFVTKEIESRNSVLREDDGWEKHVNFEANCGRFWLMARHWNTLVAMYPPVRYGTAVIFNSMHKHGNAKPTHAAFHKIILRLVQP